MFLFRQVRRDAEPGGLHVQGRGERDPGRPAVAAQVGGGVANTRTVRLRSAPEPAHIRQSEGATAGPTVRHAGRQDGQLRDEADKRHTRCEEGRENRTGIGKQQRHVQRLRLQRRHAADQG